MHKPRNAPELLRAAGLLADGPVLWGQQVRSRAPGVFLVELPAPFEAAPIDITRIRAWVDRVPRLRMDGIRPTPTALAARLAAFWMPNQRVLYIGRTSKSLGSRVQAAYVTPLGDRRPHPGGHWLKTLHRIEHMRVWWAETDAPEEYEDGLCSLFAEEVDAETRASLPDRALILPWANLDAVTGERRATGIEGALLTEADAAAATETTTPSATSDVADPTAAAIPVAASGAASMPPGSAPSTSTPSASTPSTRPTPQAASTGNGGSTTRSTAARRAPARPAGEPAVRRRRPPADLPPKPHAPPIHVTAGGLAALHTELVELQTVQRPAVINRVKHARELGDLSENADYEAARNEQSFLEGRIRTLEDMIKNAQVISGEHTGEVMLGSTVIVESGDEEMTYHIVGSTEADPVEGRISNVSPVGRALVGHRAGEQVNVQLPGHAVIYRIIEVR